MHWDGWPMFGPWMALVWLAAIVLAVVLVLAFARAAGRRKATAGGMSPAEDTLQQRFARGEIDEQEYRSRLDALRRER